MVYSSSLSLDEIRCFSVDLGKPSIGLGASYLVSKAQIQPSKSCYKFDDDQISC
jgi:hypothetical protein